MRVKIRAHSPLPGIPNLARAGRFFPTTGEREVDVLEQEDDPPPIVTEYVNPTTGRPQKLEVPDPDRMGRKSFAAIQKDGRFSIIQTSEVDTTISNAAVAAARGQVQRLAGELADAEVEIGRLQAQLDTAEEEKNKIIAEASAEIDRLRDEVRQLAEQFVKAPTGEPEASASGDATTKPADTATTPPAKPGAQGKGKPQDK